ncbi:radical SAM/SPASM domain-containing protein [Pseudothermotoga sp. U03pept]|uniref:radical SAM/SPASM domain-containing protein n=1 Tax=Pseudothermotoga sp. U03pept TaxID=3447012 RepID=UPI003EFF3CCC
MSFLDGLSDATNSVSPRFSRVLIPWILKNPRYLRQSLVLIKSFRECNSKREQLLRKEKLLVPPVMILSVTNDCNLQCSGCFVERIYGRQMTISDWHNVVAQAKELGVFAFLIAGGEPFLVDGLLDLIYSNQDRVFAVFTNATVVDDENLRQLQATSNTVVVVSLEGDEKLTDERRGMGVYEKAIRVLQKLSKRGVLSGVSITITSDNFTYWIKDENIDKLTTLGVKLCFFIEYIAAEQDIKMLSDEQHKIFREKVLRYKEEKPIFFVHSPGDEQPFGGCVSAGRGFVHVNAFGDLTPCPVSTVSTHNLKRTTLKEALSGELLKEIRENRLLEDGKGPCSLIFHQAEVLQILQKVKSQA